jgi:hypothetical protein
VCTAGLPARPGIQEQLGPVGRLLETSGTTTRGRNTVAIEHQTQRALRDWHDDNFDLDDLGLPTQRTWRRCGAVHCIDHGPWIGTLVCCIRQSGHADDHSMSLGDAGQVDYWRETWF